MTTLQVDYEWVEQKVKELRETGEEVSYKDEYRDYQVGTLWPDSDIVRAALAEAYQKGAESDETVSALLDYISTLQVREATLMEEVGLLKIKLYDMSATNNNAIVAYDNLLRDLITKPED